MFVFRFKCKLPENWLSIVRENCEELCVEPLSHQRELFIVTKRISGSQKLASSVANSSPGKPQLKPVSKLDTKNVRVKQVPNSTSLINHKLADQRLDQPSLDEIFDKTDEVPVFTKIIPLTYPECNRNGLRPAPRQISSVGKF